jgi:hypothetical protein
MSLTHTISKIANDNNLKSLAHSYGVDVMRVSWEDTSRSKNSSCGLNITDMTLSCEGTNMPVIRKPNFADVTCDQPIEKFMVTVGNEVEGGTLTQIPLKEYLENIQKYTGNPNIAKMYCDRDTQILTSAQACILPLQDGEVEFCVQIYNYQSNRSNDPAVLVIMTSSQGTSCQVVYGETQVYFNDAGVARNMLAKRLTDDRKSRGVSLEGPMTTDEKNRNALFIYQIPLLQRQKSSQNSSYKCEESSSEESVGCAGGAFDDEWDDCEYECENTKSKYKKQSVVRGFEKAVLSKGREMGRFTGTNSLILFRDTRYPIRCTYQSYNVTDSSTVTEAQIKEISEAINAVYTKSDASGSLVVGGKTDRKTESDMTKPVFSTTSFAENILMTQFM